MTLCLIVLNVAIYFGGVYGGGLSNVWDQLGFLTVRPAWYTAITHQFIHGGLMHLIGNMWFLWLFGTNLEDLMGRIGYVVYYLAGGAVAAFAFKISFNMTSDMSVPLGGASGAISAVMGGYFVLFPRSWVKCVFLLGWIPIPFSLPAVVFLGIYFVYQFAMMKILQFSSVAYMAHAGGFAFGALILWIMIAARVVIVPHLDKVKRGEFARVTPEDELMGKVEVAYEKKQFGALPRLYRELVSKKTEVEFTPEQQMRLADAVREAEDFHLATQLYRGVMEKDPHHELARKCGLEAASILAFKYKAKIPAMRYLQWVIRAGSPDDEDSARAKEILSMVKAGQPG